MADNESKQDTPAAAKPPAPPAPAKAPVKAAESVAPAVEPAPAVPFNPHAAAVDNSPPASEKVIDMKAEIHRHTSEPDPTRVKPLAEDKVAQMKDEVFSGLRPPNPDNPGPTSAFTSTQMPQPGDANNVELASAGVQAGSVSELLALAEEEASPEARRHLQVVRDHSNEVTVTEFSQLSGVPMEVARKVLDRYVAQGLMEEGWRQAAARYKLTPQGLASC